MQLKDWLATSNTSIKAFARAVNVERAMIYRYFLGTIPRARIIHRIEGLTGGAVTAQDFYATAVRRMEVPAAPVMAGDLPHAALPLAHAPVPAGLAA